MNVVEAAIAHAEAMQVATKETEWTVCFGDNEFRTGKLELATDQIYYLASPTQTYFAADKVIFLYPNS